MSDTNFWDGLARLEDVFFNGREAKLETPVNNLAQMIRRGKQQLVRCDGKLYEVTFKEVKPTK